MPVSIKKNTFNRLHKQCQRGEKHDNLINRLLDVCIESDKKINISDETTDRLLEYTGCNNVNEALNILLDKCSNIIK